MQSAKENLRLLASLIVVGIIGISLLFSLFPQKSPEKSPKPTPPVQEEPEWYIKFTVRNQKSTAYTEEAGAPLAANGKNYFIGGIAVHPRYPVNAGGEPRQPLLPFGTVIHLEKPIQIQGQEFTALTVMDTGDINYRLWSNYPYWIDVYYGTGNYHNNKDARNYGVPLVNYSWYEKWQ